MIPVLWSAEGLLAVDKPASVPVIPGRSEAGEPPLRERLEAQLGRRLGLYRRLLLLGLLGRFRRWFGWDWR